MKAIGIFHTGTGQVLHISDFKFQLLEGAEQGNQKLVVYKCI